MRERFLENWKEKSLYGCLLGMVLFICTVIYVGLQKDKEFALALMPWFAVLLAGYLLLGVGFVLFYKRKRKKESLFSFWFKGASAYYWMDLVVIIFVVCAVLLEGFSAVREIVLLDLFLLGGFMILDYLSLSKIARELNQFSVQKLSLVVDLMETPKTAEDFCREIEAYCEKNHRTLEFIERDRPAQILMDNERYTVELDHFYSQFGPMCALKFVQERQRKEKE